MTLAECPGRPARVPGPQSRRGWFGCTPLRSVGAGLARPPHRGLGRGLSTRCGALAPACASHDDTPRQTALPGPADPAVQTVSMFRRIR
jgi:hypothetical protein